MAARQTVVTPCKVNLHLGVHAERDSRGYHRVDSVMVPVGPTDTLTIDDADGLEVSFEPALCVPPHKTTVWKAATLLAEALGREPRVSIRVRAEIPERAGLGGSSADAAAALRGLAERWGVDPLDPVVVDVARRVGADVAFFLDPVAPALFDVAGDHRVEVFPELAGLPVVLVMPRCEGGNTAECYAEFDREPAAPGDFGPLCEALRAGDVAGVAAGIANNLAPAACRLAPEVAEALAWLRCQEGVVAAQVTGSGACSFAICESHSRAAQIAEKCANSRDWWTKATMTLGAGDVFC